MLYVFILILHHGRPPVKGGIRNFHIFPHFFVSTWSRHKPLQRAFAAQKALFGRFSRTVPRDAHRITGCCGQGPSPHFLLLPGRGCGRNSVAACSRRVRTAPLSSLTGLAFVLGPGSPAINRWAILYRPAGLDCAMAELCGPVKLKAILYRPSSLDFAPVLLRRPIRPTGAIDNSPPFQRWVPIANPIPKPRRGERRLGCALVSGGIRIRHRMPTAPPGRGPARFWLKNRVAYAIIAACLNWRTRPEWVGRQQLADRSADWTWQIVEGQRNVRCTAVFGIHGQ